MGGWRTATALLAAVTLASGCSLASPGEQPSDRAEAPELGACRVLVPEDVSEPTNDSDVVPCTERHTAETFLVGHLPATTGTAYTRREHGAHVHRTCAAAFERFLGADESLAMRTRLTWAWFRASEQAWDEGARWFRCDLVGGQADDAAFRDLPRTAKALLAEEETSRWMNCARGAELATSTKLFCDEPHDWRAVTAIKIGRPDDPYPGDAISESRARTGCSDWVGAWMNYPTDYEFAYSTFHEAEWKAGNRRAVCWARTDK